MFLLEILLNKSEFNGIKYYSSSMRPCSCNSNVEKIRSYIKSLHKDEVEDIISF